MVAANTEFASNRLLAALASKDLTRLRPHLEQVSLLQRQVISEPDTAAEYVFFPEQGFVSLMQPMADKFMVEVGIVGCEGFVGSHVLLGVASSPLEAMVQAPGTALRMRAGVLSHEAGRSAALRDILLRFAQALHVQVSQTAACNARHTLPQRLARWLLTARDRVGGDELALSHEFLAIMLGMRRAGVTIAVGALKKAGLIENTQARIRIRDRRGLEAAACECYRAVRKEYKRLLP